MAPTRAFIGGFACVILLLGQSTCGGQTDHTGKNGSDGGSTGAAGSGGSAGAGASGGGGSGGSGGAPGPGCSNWHPIGTCKRMVDPNMSQHCSSWCDGPSGERWQEDCNIVTKHCTCSYNGQVMCSCGTDSSCTSCCPGLP